MRAVSRAGNGIFRILAFLVLLVALSACLERSEEEDPIRAIRFGLGIEFVYEWSRTFKDASGTQVSFDRDTLVVRVGAINDALHGYPALIRLELRELGSSALLSASWFKHDETGLYQVGSYLPASRLWFPKRADLSPGMVPFDLGPIPGETAVADTVWRDEPRKVFGWPLEKGATWISLTSPFQETREVTADNIVYSPAGVFETLTIRTLSPENFPDRDWTDLVAIEGLIARAVIQSVGPLTSEERLTLIQYRP